MQLLFVLPTYEPAWKFGGVVSCISTLCRALAAEGVDVTVYTTNASGSDLPLDVPLNQPVELGGVKVWYFKSVFGPRSNFYSVGLINKLSLTIRNFDVLYVSAIWQWLGVEVAKLSRRNNVSMVIGTHGSFSVNLMKKSGIKKKLYIKLFLLKALKSAAAIHLTTQSEKKDAVGLFNSMRSFIIPNAVDPEKFRPVPGGRERFRSRHGISIDAPVLVTVGRPDWMKRVDLLIRAISKNKDWKLVVAGPDNEGRAPEWKSLAMELEVSDRVIWTGLLHGDELLDALAAADLFALVSENENFGMVAVEAMMCGLPVMLSQGVGVWDLLKDENFLITVEKTEVSVAQGLADFERMQMSAAGWNDTREAAIERFSPRVVARQFLQETSKIAKLKYPE